jgi:hypothetical protein
MQYFIISCNISWQVPIADHKFKIKNYTQIDTSNNVRIRDASFNFYTAHLFFSSFCLCVPIFI